MKPIRAGYYCNTGTVNIPVPSGNIKPNQKIHSTHPDFEKISQYYEHYLTHETAVSPHLRGAFKDFTTTTYVDKIVDGAIDALLTPLPDSIETKVKPMVEPVKEIISDVIEDLLHIDQTPDVSKTQTSEAPVVDPPKVQVVDTVAPEKPKKRKVQ